VSTFSTGKRFTQYVKSFYFTFQTVMGERVEDDDEEEGGEELARGELR
jgi:hypothetical protein